MVNIARRAVPFWTLQPSKFVLNLFAGLAFSLVIFGSDLAIANPDSVQITLSIDAAFSPTFSDLVDRAEALAESEISQRFQADPNINELQVTVLAERNGQFVSLLSSQISRSAWQSGSNIHQWTRYLATSSALLGYRNSDPISVPVPRPRLAPINRVPTNAEESPSETLERARLSRRISEEEYWRLVDAMD